MKKLFFAAVALMMYCAAGAQTVTEAPATTNTGSGVVVKDGPDGTQTPATMPAPTATATDKDHKSCGDKKGGKSCCSKPAEGTKTEQKACCQKAKGGKTCGQSKGEEQHAVYAQPKPCCKGKKKGCNK